MPVFQRADFLIPQKQYLPLWPVIACDQFTSQGDYWKKVAETVGDAPSSYHIIFPEAELGEDERERIAQIERTMVQYLAQKVFCEYPNSYIHVERTLLDGSVRRGLLGVIDLEAYDYRDEAKTPVRATERTVVSRIPPRVKIRAGAPLESSHVLLFCQDPKDSLFRNTEPGEPLYDLNLMQGGGRLRGWLIGGEAADRLDRAIARYEQEAEDGFCYAVGDGNHSLAAAKACWEEIKKSGGAALSSHPARWAMVELENLFDPAQRFEPIHRIVRGVDTQKLLAALQKDSAPLGAPVSWHTKSESGFIRFGESALPADALQRALDAYLSKEGGSIDYIHGEDVAVSLAEEGGAVAFILPGIEKEALFGSIARGGVLPRKTFSVGRAEEKRYYLECRRIKP